MEYLISSPLCRYHVEENFTMLERFEMKTRPKWWMSQCVYVKREIQHGTYCFTVYTVKFTLFLYLNSHLFPLLTCLIYDSSTTSLKICAPELSMKCTIFYLQCQSIFNVILLTSAGVFCLSITWKEGKIGLFQSFFFPEPGKMSASEPFNLTSHPASSPFCP